jgi:hypothetical protein
MAYMQGSSFIDDWVVLELSNALPSASTVVWPLSFNSIFYTNNATTAAQTINLPTSPSHGDMLTISNLGAITALTFVPPVTGGFSPTYGQGLQIRYSATLPGWAIFS